MMPTGIFIYIWLFNQSIQTGATIQPTVWLSEKLIWDPVIKINLFQKKLFDLVYQSFADRFSIKTPTNRNERVDETEEDHEGTSGHAPNDYFVVTDHDYNAQNESPSEIVEYTDDK